MDNMRDLLKHTLGRSLHNLSQLDRLEAAWPVACGPVLARRARIVSFEEGILDCIVDDPAWLDQLGSMRPLLERELARIAEVPLRGIHFQVARTGPRPGLKGPA